jgi:hypothetical protein
VDRKLDKCTITMEMPMLGFRAEVHRLGSTVTYLPQIVLREEALGDFYQRLKNSKDEAWGTQIKDSVGVKDG